MTSGGQRLAASLIVAMFLVIASDFPTTAPLAVAFSYLILLVALMIYGPAAFGNLQSLITPAGRIGGSGGHKKP